MSAHLRERWQMRGAVQGVGLRPWLARESRRCGVTGFVQNTLDGVTAEVEGSPLHLDALRDALTTTASDRVALDALVVTRLPLQCDTTFEIRESLDTGAAHARVPRDRAPCPRCLASLRDPADRRFRYPFVSCTVCGPRFTILEALPFDRERTAMRAFPTCAACEREYRDPDDLRYHSQTQACAACGPALWLEAPGAVTATGEAALAAAISRIAAGGLLAAKGVGGYQLVCRANAAPAVARIRAWKARSRKPLALLVRDLTAARRLCRVSDAEAAWLESAVAPIVLLGRTAAADVEPAVAPALDTLGVMLPASPLHALLADAFGEPLVVTSGNRGGEPIVTDDDDARATFAGVVDALLGHTRVIAHMADDSVVRFAGDVPIVLRHARGLAPSEFPCALANGAALATGGYLKAAVAIAGRERLVLGQHIGDLATRRARVRHAEAAARLAQLYGSQTQQRVTDAHPDGAADVVPDSAVRIQHHLAHVLAIAAEHALTPPFLGFACDGLGTGTDGTLWGGEVLLVTQRDDGPFVAQRFATLRDFPLPGGEAAAREPRRTALGVDWACAGGAVDATRWAHFSEGEQCWLAAALDKGINVPRTTSLGRLFDAVASLLDVCQVADYEGEAAMRLEALADTRAIGDCDSTAIGCAVDMERDSDGMWRWNWAATWRALAAAVARGVPRPALAAAFHACVLDWIERVCLLAGQERVLLSGGVFQNARLVRGARERLTARGFTVFTAAVVPPNDGALALGQVYAALAGASIRTQTPDGETSCA